MAEPILAVDFGAFQTSAALVQAAQWRVVGASDTVGSWPALERADATTEDLAAALRSIGAQARRHDPRVVRLAMASSRPAAPPTGPTDDQLIAAGQAAGFSDVELVPAPVAAVLDPASGPDHPAGELVLVCTFDTTWATTLVRLAGEQTAVLARQVMPESTGPELAARLRWVAESSAKLVREVGVDPAAAVLTGDWVPLRGLAEQLQPRLPAPVRAAAEPEFAVFRGVIRWAAGAARRRVPAEPGRWRVGPLSWSMPGRDATVLRWLVREGQPFPGGAVLAQVRTSDDRIFDLAAAGEGTLLAHRVPPRARTGASLVAAVAPSVTAAVHDPPPHLHQWTCTGGWLLTPRQLVEWDRTGGYVHSRSLADGAIAGELRPDHGTGAPPQRAGVFVDAAGRFCLITWDLAGEFRVWDIAAGALRSRFSGPPGTRRILVNEGRWRMATEEQDAVSVGRYRRTAVTVWDLDTGQRIDRRVADDWTRRHPGYAPRSAADRFGVDAASPDGRLRAAVSDGLVVLRETATDQQVFQSTLPLPRDARTAFSADGRFLLAACDADDRSVVDVWQL